MPVVAKDSFSEVMNEQVADAMLFSSGNHVLITPDDDNELAEVTRGIVISEEAQLHIVTKDNQELTLPAGLLAPGIVHSLRWRKIFATDTTSGVTILAVY